MLISPFSQGNLSPGGAVIKLSGNLMTDFRFEEMMMIDGRLIHDINIVLEVPPVVTMERKRLLLPFCRA